MELTWSAAAAILADETEEHGLAAAALVASAWNAGMHPDATKALMEVSVVLTDIAVVNRFWDKSADPCDSADGYAVGCEEIAAELSAAAQRATAMARHCWGVLSDALDVHARAAAAITAAQALPDAEGQAAASAASERRQQMDMVIADCEAAMETIHQCGEQLNQALRHLGRSEDDVEYAYEPVLEFIRDGGVLPKDGDFITEDTAFAAEGG